MRRKKEGAKVEDAVCWTSFTMSTPASTPCGCSNKRASLVSSDAGACSTLRGQLSGTHSIADHDDDVREQMIY